MPHIDTFARDLEVAIRRSQTDHDLLQLVQYMRRLGGASSATANSAIELRFVASDYLTLDASRSIDESFETLIRQLCGVNIAFYDCLTMSTKELQNILGTYAPLVSVACSLLGREEPCSEDVLEDELDMPGAFEPIRKLRAPAPPYGLVAAPAPQGMSAPIASSSRNLQRPIALHRATPEGLEEAVLCRDGGFYERATAEAMGPQDTYTLVCTQWPQITTKMWIRLAEHRVTLQAEVPATMLSDFMQGLGSVCNTPSEDALDEVLTLYRRYTREAGLEVIDGAQSALCRIILRNARAVLNRADDPALRQLRWQALTCVGRSFDTEEAAQKFFEALMGLSFLPSQNAAVWAGLALAVSQGPTFQAPDAFVIKHLDDLATPTPTSWQRTVQAESLAHLASPLMTVPESERHELSRALGSLWQELGQDSLIWAQGRLIRALLLAPQVMRRPLQSLIVEEHDAPAHAAQLDIILEPLLDVLRQSQSDPDLLKATHRLLTSLHVAASTEHLRQAYRALSNIERTRRTGLVDALIVLVGKEGKRHPYLLPMSDIIRVMGRLQDADWVVLMRERGALHTFTKDHGAYVLHKFEVLTRFLAHMREEGAYAQHALAITSARHAAAPKESVESEKRRTTLIADLMRLKQLLPASQQPDEHRALGGITRYIKDDPEANMHAQLVRERALWAISEIDRRRAIATDNPLSIAATCAVIWQLINNQRDEHDTSSSKDRKNMRCSLVLKLASCVEDRGNFKSLVCANGQGQQLISVLYGFGFKLPGEADVLKCTPAELLVQFSQQFATKLSRLQVEEPDQALINLFVRESLEGATSLFGSETDEWRAFKAQLDSYLVNQEWAVAP